MFGRKKREKQQTHAEMIAELKELECNLEVKAAADYQENKNDLMNCIKCNVPPEHEYDSFGMPMHELKCPVCGVFVTFPKSFEEAKNKWNALQKGEMDEKEKAIFCEGSLNEAREEREIWQMNFDLAINRIRYG